MKAEGAEGRKKAEIRSSKAEAGRAGGSPDVPFCLCSPREASIIDPGRETVETVGCRRRGAGHTFETRC